MVSWRAVSLLVCAVGCSSPGERLALPEVGEARTLLWGVRAGIGETWTAVDLEEDLDAEAMTFSLERSGQARVYAVTYRETLAELGLSAGPIVLGGPSTIPDLVSTTVFARAVTADEVTPWEVLEAWQPELASVSLTRRSPCGSFEILQVLPLDQGDVVITAIVQHASGSTLLAAAATHDSPVRLVAISLQGEDTWGIAGSGPQLPFEDVTAVSGEWFAGRTSTVGEEIVHVRGDGVVDRTVASPLPGTAPNAIEERDGVLFAMTTTTGAETQVWKRVGETWTSLHREVGPTRSPTPRIVALSTDELWFLTPQSTRVGWYKADRSDGSCGGEAVCTFDTTLPMVTDVRNMDAHDALGPIVSVLPGGGLLRLDGPPGALGTKFVRHDGVSANSVAGYLPIDTGFLVGTVASSSDVASTGVLGEFHAAFGACPGLPLSKLSIYAIARIEDDRLLVTGVGPSTPDLGDMGPHSTVFVVKWTRP